MVLRANTDLTVPAAVLLEIVNVVRAHESDELRRWALHTLDHACRQLECFVRPEVSVGAAAAAAKLGLNDLTHYTWHDQVSRMGDPGRQIFHWEHVLPVAEVKRRLLDPSIQTVEQVLAIIKFVDIAWILKDEDLALTAKGFSHRRPDNPWDAYSSANIAMVRLASAGDV